MNNITKSPQDTIKLWEKLAQKYDKLLLYWDLWSWKTHLVKWFVKWKWLNPNIVKSPTYTYLNIYEDKILHIDMYRINHPHQFIEKGLLEEINNYPFVIIEWPKFEDLYIHLDRKKIFFKKIDKNTRLIKSNNFDF